jgi:hypothetical protein
MLAWMMEPGNQRLAAVNGGFGLFALVVGIPVASGAVYCIFLPFFGLFMTALRRHRMDCRCKD